MSLINIFLFFLQEACTSGSATSVDLGDLPFDMPKLRRRLRVNQSQAEPTANSGADPNQIANVMIPVPGLSTGESSEVSQVSSSHSVREDSQVNLSKLGWKNRGGGFIWEEGKGFVESLQIFLNPSSTSV